MDETARVDQSVLLEASLVAIEELLDRSEESPSVRASRVEVGKLRRAIARWQMVPPERDQIAAMHEVITALHDRVLRAGPSGSAIDPPPSSYVR